MITRNSRRFDLPSRKTLEERRDRIRTTTRRNQYKFATALATNAEMRHSQRIQIASITTKSALEQSVDIDTKYLVTQLPDAHRGGGGGRGGGELEEERKTHDHLSREASRRRAQTTSARRLSFPPIPLPPAPCLLSADRPPPPPPTPFLVPRNFYVCIANSRRR